MNLLYIEIYGDWWLCNKPPSGFTVNWPKLSLLWFSKPFQIGSEFLQDRTRQRPGQKEAGGMWRNRAETWGRRLLWWSAPDRQTCSSCWPRRRSWARIAVPGWLKQERKHLMRRSCHFTVILNRVLRTGAGCDDIWGKPDCRADLVSA